MSWVILRKTLRDAGLLMLVLTLGVVALEMAVVRAVLELSRDLASVQHWLGVPLVRDLVRIALGADLLGDLGPTSLATFGMGHPLLYALSWTLLLTTGSGAIAGEVDRGTADLLLTLPVTRRAVYISTSLAWVLGALLVSFAAPLGLWLGELVCPLSQPLELVRFWPVAVNLLGLNLSVAGLTMLVSSLLSRRAVAVGIVLAALLASDLIKFLAQFWPAVRPFSFLGFQHYYRPLPVVRSGQLPVADLAVLLSVALAAWLAGLWYFSRRDIPAA